MFIEVIFRTLVLYFTILIVIRLMGKREVGQLSAFDLVIAIMIAELAAMPMENTDIPLYIGVTPILVLAGMEVIFSKLSLKSQRFRSVLTGVPSILVENGQILEEQLKKQRYNINDLISQLREKDVANISDVEYAILEPSGHLSVILKSQKRPVTPEDLNIQTSYEGLPYPLVIDGSVDYDNLERINLDPCWLQDELKKLGFQDFKQVLLASLDTQGRLYVSRKDNMK